MINGQKRGSREETKSGFHLALPPREGDRGRGYRGGSKCRFPTSPARGCHLFLRFSTGGNSRREELEAVAPAAATGPLLPWGSGCRSGGSCHDASRWTPQADCIPSSPRPRCPGPLLFPFLFSLLIDAIATKPGFSEISNLRPTMTTIPNPNTPTTASEKWTTKDSKSLPFPRLRCQSHLAPCVFLFTLQHLLLLALFLPTAGYPDLLLLDTD